MAANREEALRVIGLISGTSVDGIDVAAAEIWLDGTEVVLTPLGALDLPYPARVRDDLLAALPPNPCSAEQLTKLDTQVGQAFAAAALRGIAELAGGAVDLIASLGQTAFHWVADGQALGTLQLGQPAWIAEHTGRPVMADLRIRDITAGGHGAPLAGTLDALWLAGMVRETGCAAAALNVGGIANISVLAPGSDVLAYDTGPGNALLDLAARQVSGGAQQRDENGALAAKGTVHGGLLEALLADPFYRRKPPKSTGKEYFTADYLRTHTARFAALADADLLATLTELTAVTVADACARHAVGTVVASGGGVQNPVLMRALDSRLGPEVTLRTSNELGLPVDSKEAYLTALIGWLSWYGLPANLPSATGAAGSRLLGSITPGASPLRLPEPFATRPTTMRIANPTPHPTSSQTEEGKTDERS